jgi:hypothetical protein
MVNQQRGLGQLIRYLLSVDVTIRHYEKMNMNIQCDWTIILYEEHLLIFLNENNLRFIALSIIFIDLKVRQLQGWPEATNNGGITLPCSGQT